MNLISGPGRKGILPKSYNQKIQLHTQMKHKPGYSVSPNLQKPFFILNLWTLNIKSCILFHTAVEPPLRRSNVRVNPI